MYVEESAPIIITHWEWDAMEPASHAELFTNDASREGGGIGQFLTEEGSIREFGTDKGEGVKIPDVIFEGPHITN